MREECRVSKFSWCLQGETSGPQLCGHVREDVLSTRSKNSTPMAIPYMAICVTIVSSTSADVCSYLTIPAIARKWGLEFTPSLA